MATLKRKRHTDHEPAPQPRRATRQHPTAPEEHQLRSGRIRAHTIEKPTIAHIESIEKRGRRGDASKIKTTRNTATDTNTTASSKALKENVQPQDNGKKEHKNTSVSSLRANKVSSATATATTTTRPAASSPPPQTRLMPPSRKPSLQQQTLRPARTTPTNKTSTPKRPASSPSKPPIPPGTPRSDRNIDKVVLGNICFRAWYPSYYGKEVLGDASGNQGAKDKDGGGKLAGGAGRIGGGKRAGLPPPVLDRLYVCPCCFKYSKELVAWWEHVRCCERRFEMPGRKVYTHPKGKRNVRRLAAPGAAGGEAGEKGKGRGRKKSDAGALAQLAAEDVVKDEGEWSVWEVDGEKDRLFCQNLSLFAKLFLDNKSVFFDVTGFNYFLLVYTPRPSNTQPPPSLASNLPQPPAPASGTEPSHHQPTPTSLPEEEARSRSRPQVVGFFSKEKLSWDNNNLACILVFPPWQRKGLGALLMGVSYEISRREAILGGPEKPISELGRRGYKRFWAGEIARWLLGLEVGSDAEAEAEDGGETLVSIDQCSRATWIVPEDCLAVLREMGGVVEDAGLGPAETSDHPADPAERESSIGAAAAAAGPEAVTAAEVEAGRKEEVRMVPRVRVDKAAVRRWVEAHGIDLARACDPDGFVEGYAVKGGEGEEMDEA